MPLAAPKPCTRPGCRRLIPYGQQCPDHPRNWGKQDKRRGNRHERGYGNDWVRLRGEVMLRDKGLCQPCMSQARYTPAAEVDHIVLKAQGGTDDTANLQAICRSCHSLKTAYESTGQGASAMPEWLPSPCVPVMVIVGPPCSGKTTRARELATSNDLLVDFEEIAARLKGPPPGNPRTLDQQARTNALRIRNALLASLADTGCLYSKAILTVTAGKPEQREWWRQKLNATVVVMDTPKDVCKARARALGLPTVRELELLKAIDAWR